MNDSPRTLFEKIWDRHVVVPETAETPAVLYIDLHLVHEVTSPQAFDVLRGTRSARCAARTGRSRRWITRRRRTRRRSFGGVPIAVESAARQVRQLERNCAEFGIELLGPAGRRGAASCT